MQLKDSWEASAVLPKVQKVAQLSPPRYETGLHVCNNTSQVPNGKVALGLVVPSNYEYNYYVVLMGGPFSWGNDGFGRWGFFT